MFKRENIKGFIFGVIITLTMVSTVTVFASGKINKKIEVLYNNIKLVVNGSPIEFDKDLSGKKIEPFVYNGTTYLPVRAVAEALGEKVSWDDKTWTAYIGATENIEESEKKSDNEKYEYMTEVIEPTARGIDTRITKLDGKSGKITLGEEKYDSGYRMQASDGENYMIFQLDEKYTEITGFLGIEPYHNLTTNELSIYLDGKLYKTIVVDPKERPQEISIPVKGVKEFKIESPGKNYARIAFVDPKIR